jgi:hypothetical protein
VTRFVLSGDLRATTFSAVHASLAVLGPAITVHHDVDFDWREPGAVDITFESSASLGGRDFDYVVRGTVDDQLDAAMARVRRIAEELDSRDIAYRFELDHDDGETVVIQSGGFPVY